MRSCFNKSSFVPNESFRNETAVYKARLTQLWTMWGLRLAVDCKGTFSDWADCEQFFGALTCWDICSFVESRVWSIVGCQLETRWLSPEITVGKKKVKTQKQENTSFASSLLLITFKLMPICAMPQNHPCAHLRFAQAPSQGSCTAWCKSSRWSQSGAHAFWWFVLIRPVVSCRRKAPVYRHASTGYWYVMVCIVQTECVKILVVCLLAWVITSMYLEEKPPNASLPDTTHGAS